MLYIWQFLHKSVLTFASAAKSSQTARVNSFLDLTASQNQIPDNRRRPASVWNAHIHGERPQLVHLIKNENAKGRRVLFNHSKVSRWLPKLGVPRLCSRHCISDDYFIMDKLSPAIHQQLFLGPVNDGQRPSLMSTTKHNTASVPF